MLRIALLAAAALALAGSASSTHTFEQRGTVAGPRAPHHDGQPLDGRARFEVHGGTYLDPALDDGEVAVTQSNAAAVAQHSAGGSVRFRVGPSVDLGLEVDSAWAPTSHGVDGTPLDAPDAAAITTVATLRTSAVVGEHGRIGFALDVGGSSTPIYRANETVDWNDASFRVPADPATATPPIQRDTAPVARLAVVPSYRVGSLTLFGSLGAATETLVPPIIRWVDDGGSNDDPGVQAEAAGMAFTVAAGATLDAGNGARLTARIGDAYGGEVAAGHYGPQVDVALSFDVGK